MTQPKTFNRYKDYAEKTIDYYKGIENVTFEISEIKEQVFDADVVVS